jgi:hypothetical protein
MFYTQYFSVFMQACFILGPDAGVKAMESMHHFVEQHYKRL